MKGIMSMFRFLFYFLHRHVLAPRLRDYLGSILLLLLFYQKSVDYIYVTQFLASLFCSIDLSVFSQISYCLDYCKFVVESQNQVASFLQLYSSSIYCVCYSESFASP